MNVTIPQEAQKNIERLIMFLYEAIGFPAKSTLMEAIRKGHFATWPGMTVKRVQKYVTQKYNT